MTSDSAQQENGPLAQGAVLRRLLRARNSGLADAGAAPGMPQGVRQTPARAAATAVSRAAEALYGLALRATSVIPGGLTQAEMPELLPEQALLVVVGGPQETLGVVALDSAVVTTLIEVQALGRMTARSIDNRKLTRSDAMMCSPFVNRLLTELQLEMSGLDGFEGYEGFSYVSYLDDPRPLMLMLEDTTFRSLRMSITLGGDAARRQGQIFVALPQRRHAAAPPPAVISRAAPIQADATLIANNDAAITSVGQRESLQAAVQTAPVELLGVLCRRKVSLGDLRGLQPGMLLALPRVSLYDARIETSMGQVLAHGKLGEADGCHAIRLHDPDSLRAAPAAAISDAVDLARPVALPGRVPMDTAPVNLDQPDEFRSDHFATASAVVQG